MQTLQSSNLPLWLSSDGVTYKQLVCIENYTLKLDTINNKTQTFCGIALGVGITEFSIDASAVCELAKTATQVTNDDVASWQINNTILWFKMQFPSPGSSATNIFFSGQVYVTGSTFVAAVNEVVKFTVAFTGTGTLDITP